jgi:hypothetical protein
MRTVKWKYEDDPKMVEKMKEARRSYYIDSQVHPSETCPFCKENGCEDCPASWTNYEILNTKIPESGGCAYLGRILLKELDEEKIR